MTGEVLFVVRDGLSAEHLRLIGALLFLVPAGELRVLSAEHLRLIGALLFLVAAGKLLLRPVPVLAP